VGLGGLDAAWKRWAAWRARTGLSRPRRRNLVMRRTHGTAQLGDLIAAAFDEAARYSADPREVSRLATQAVRHLMRRAGRMSVPLPATCA
jgi:hypothetical protein